MEAMKLSSAAPRRHLAASPFNKPRIEPPIENYSVDDRVSHDSHGLGSVIGVEDDVAVLVDFGSCKVRVTSPFTKLTKL